jgi:ATP-dependent Clp protease adaptor protein ClpS
MLNCWLAEMQNLPIHLGPRLPAGQEGTEGEGAVQTANRVDVPKMYKVIVLNDDYTPMDFVVLVLKRFFGKTEDQATAIMLDVHKKGAGVAGVYTLEIAEMRVMQCNQFARMNQHPLKTTLEPE